MYHKKIFKYCKGGRYLKFHWRQFISDLYRHSQYLSQKNRQERRNQLGFLIDVLHCCFSVKSLFHGLKWKFRSLVVHWSNNHSSMLDTFAMRLLRSTFYWRGYSIYTIFISVESWKLTKSKLGTEFAIWIHFRMKNEFSKFFTSIFT